MDVTINQGVVSQPDQPTAMTHGEKVATVCGFVVGMFAGGLVVSVVAFLIAFGVVLSKAVG